MKKTDKNKEKQGEKKCKCFKEHLFPYKICSCICHAMPIDNPNKQSLPLSGKQSLSLREKPEWEEELMSLLDDCFELNVTNTNNHPNCIYSIPEDTVNMFTKDLKSFISTLLSQREVEVKKYIRIALKSERENTKEKIREEIVKYFDEQDIGDNTYILKYFTDDILSLPSLKVK